MRRRRDSFGLTDTIIVAVNPALIILMIVTLVYFLLEVFYRGNYSGRLQWTFFFFTLGAVFVVRLFMTGEADARGWFYAGGLSLATLAAMARFIEYADLAVPPVLVNAALMAIIWFYAYKLTTDCTWDDDNQESSGQGILDASALGTRYSESAGYPRRADRPGGAGQDTSLITGRSQVSGDGEKLSEDTAHLSTSWWTRLWSRGKKHTPGVWIVYFGLAALPIFGLGQTLIPLEEAPRRRYGFYLLVVHLLAATLLLALTSLLGIRRYLRQKGVTPPGRMTVAWTVTALTIAVGCLLVAMIPPRPDEVNQSWMAYVQSLKRSASPYAIVPGEGEQKDSGQSSSSGASEHPKEVEGHQHPKGRSNPASKDPQGQFERSPSDRSQDKPGRSDSASGKGEHSQPGKAQGQSPSSSAKEGKSSGGSDRQPRGQPRHPDDQAQQSRSDPSARQLPESSPPQPQRSPEPPPQTWSAWLSSLVQLLRWLLLIVLLAVLAYYAWRYFARSSPKNTADGTGEPSVKPVEQVPFSSYRNPFVSGQAERMTAEELTRYTFRALEAWARDSGWPRQAHETALEFIGRIGSTVIPLADLSGELSHLVAIACYSPMRISAKALPLLRKIWELMESTYRPPVRSGS
ncbi:MAG: hypothetical protein C4297_13210 [Gemmataceae bacterium]